MKKLLFLGLFALLFSCQQSLVSDPEEMDNKIVYFKDKRTGLCFGAINTVSYAGYAVTSIACVPCDSLRRFEGF